MSSCGTHTSNFNVMATSNGGTYPSPLFEQLPDAKNAQVANTQTFIIEGYASQQVYLRQHVAHRQGQIIHAPSYVCEWTPTSLRLPSQDTHREDVYLCLPVRSSEISYSKQNEEKEECKDDEYCSTTTTQLRLLELDRYLSTLHPLVESSQRLLFGVSAPVAQYGNNHEVGHKNSQNMGHPDHRSKYERQPKLRAKQPPKAYHRLVTSTNCGRVINVLQGEIAHCTPSQADVLVSDDATTCHIVALRSRCLGLDKGEKMTGAASGSAVLATMTHIDGPGYEASIRNAVNEHIRHHSNHSKQHDAEECKENVCSPIIDMSIHIMGGFNDQEGSSIEITESILQIFAAISNEYNVDSTRRTLPHLRMTLETCAVSSTNDNGTGCPLGRGLAMNVALGKVFLAEIEDDIIHDTASLSRPLTACFNGIGMDPNAKCVDNSAQGPHVTLRSMRLWASAFHSRGGKHESRLNIIHRPDRDHLCVEPFFFGPHPAVKGLLDCSDEELLQITSTSPQVEKSNFVSKVRESLNFMSQINSSRVFTGDQPMEFCRVGLNGWVHNS
mmetsp:Transcript_28487/g.60360  ORF Transcript_28487/g.60360 Transcript_28487/m.60360 type:complete len:555 (+) Transcript_28487:387-2051(+)